MQKQDVIYRKVSIFFSLLFVKLKFSANLVTFLSFLSDILVICLIAANHWITAGILVNLAIILDCSDGEVARFYHLKKKTKKTFYGEYLDEVLGTIGFSLVIFFAGYFMGYWWLGVIGMFGLLINMISALCSKLVFEKKEQIARDFEKGIFGKLKGRIGFNNSKQRILISLAVLFSSVILLFLFGLLINLFWAIKFWVYRKQ